MTAMISSRARRARRAGYVAWAALGLLQVVWYLCWQPPATGHAGLAVLVPLVPLLLPLLALRRPPRALLWAGIVALFYFSHGIATAWSMPAARVPALLETLFSLVLVLAMGPSFPRRPGARSKPPGEHS